ncbi:MAG: hypothetical protein J2P37_05560 [Ktedonobacteraceae bacterium]|nr:hypothetical protein [Ktedonobacteraceae bacterium]
MLAPPRALLTIRDRQPILIKWLLALFVPLAIFTFVWSGEEMTNQVILSAFGLGNYSLSSIIQTSIFILVFYGGVIALAGYLVASDSGRRHWLELLFDVTFFVVVPLILLVLINDLLLGLAASVIIWALYVPGRKLVVRWLNYTPPAPLEEVQVLDAKQQEELKMRAITGSFWFATIFALISLIADIIFWLSGTPFPPVLLGWVVLRTLLLPVAGYFLGRLSARIALRLALTQEKNEAEAVDVGGANGHVSKRQQLQSLSRSRAQEEAKDVVPNDLPMNSKGARRFYLTLLAALVLFYPVIDAALFGPGTDGRLGGYGDAGYYIILALGLNIVVGFAGLLDLGYVAFFAIGAYTWGLVGSSQLGKLTGLILTQQLQGVLFWPLLLVAALIAAFWGVVLGAPTLRLRGDYLAIVTLGFGEIIPIVFKEMDRYTNGVNGLIGIQSPSFFGIKWASFTPIPYYYLILALIVALIFVNIRLRDSRLGRAWVAIREDEIAAASSGISLTKTKLFAFGAGAFFSGVAGMYHVAKLGSVTPDAFNTSDSIIYLAMVVIGGLGSIPGVIVGAFVVYAINVFILAQLDILATNPNNFLFPVLSPVLQAIPGNSFSSVRNLIFGVILVAIMIFRPEGMIPSTRRQRELHRAETEPVEEGSLDAAPGTAEFESEVRVE